MTMDWVSITRRAAIRSRTAVLVVLFAFGLPPAALLAGTVDEATGIELQPVAPSPAFPDAIAAGALNWVCADSLERLQASFAERRAPFEPGLVRPRDGRQCHVDYQPSLPGFRADPDDLPIAELFVNVDTLNLLSRRSEPFGDSLDISKAVVRALPRPIPITVSAEREIDRKWYDEAAEFHFGDSAGQIRWRRGRIPGQTHPWTQDFLKSGSVDGRNRLLVTRHLYEGRRRDGEIYAPMLGALESDRVIRSNLSWEGGDLQFVRDPRQPDRLVLVYGDSARGYWGEHLERGEYEYVLKREFGADAALDLSQIVPHVDYFVAFLPAARTVLVAEPLVGSREAALAAASALGERFDGSPPPSLRELIQLLKRPGALDSDRPQVEAVLARAKAEAAKGWPHRFDPVLEEQMARHVATHCPAVPQSCFSNRAIVKMLDGDLAFLRTWVTAAIRTRGETKMDERLLSIVESQLQEGVPPTQPRIEAKVRALEAMGFQVVRVPRLGGDPELEVPWAGISYANSLLVDRTLFVPRFGLGDLERKIFDDLQQKLPPDYRVVPVFARHMLLYNGGVHCTVAIVRAAS